MTISEKIGLMGLVPVVVFDRLEDALPTAKAMIDGGLPLMEITLRTEQGLPAIKAIKEVYPEILLGAGTVLSLDQAKRAVDAGASFIVSPGFNDSIANWCLDNDILITPGCVTPTEIDHALAFGINILKFFPASVYGGINGCAALYGPYRMVKFVPTGGIGLNNLSDYVDKPYIHAIGGGWLCPTKDILNKRYDQIAQTVKASIDKLLGLELAHIGINTDGEKKAEAIAGELGSIFGFDVKLGSSSNFVGSSFEIVKGAGIGQYGHIAVRTNNIDRAEYYLKQRGYEVDDTTVKEKDGKRIAVYLKNEIGGFGVHLLQK